MTILLIRHGETDGNASRIIQHPETPLNARGRAQAAKVAIKISEDRNVEAVISSDYRRAQETALEISDKIKIPPTFSDSLRERNFGDLRGKAYDEIKVICTKFQDESGATDMEVKTLLRELARVWEKDIDDDYDIDWEV